MSSSGRKFHLGMLVFVWKLSIRCMSDLLSMYDTHRWLSFCILNLRIRLWINKQADVSPYPSALKDSARFGCACAGPFPVAMIVLFTAIAHPKVEIPVDGSCPPSDAISNVDFGVIMFWIVSSGTLMIDTSPTICFQCFGAF
jgi:hypothetical protein